MITENSFFKKIPAAIDLKQRLVWEAAGWAIESIAWSFERLKSATLGINPNSTEFPRTIAREVFAHSWSIIDQCHMLRSLLGRFSPSQGSTTHNFIQKFEAATLIRNSMDHLHQKIDNLANARGARPPLFGAISFCIVDESHITRQDAGILVRGCRVVTIMAGALTHEQHRIPATNPAGRRLEFPIGLFEFHAFEHAISFSDLMIDLAALVDHYDTVVKADHELQLREFARRQGLDEEKIVGEHLASGLLIALDIGFDGGTVKVK